MIRTLLRIVLLIILVAAVAAFFIGYRLADRGDAVETEHAVGTAGDTTVGDRDRQSGAVDTRDARETGARIGQSVAEGANRAQLLARDAALTAKIKSKMALDDMVKARNIDVDSSGSTVTVSGSVASAAERDRALQLARETEGVTTVTDRLRVEAR